MKHKICIVTGFDKEYSDLANIAIPNYLKSKTRLILKGLAKSGSQNAEYESVRVKT